MAYAPYEEDEDENLSTVAQPSGAGLSSAGQYGTTQVNNPSTPGKFTNFSSYFNANSGAAGGMATKLGDRLEGDASGALSGADKTLKTTTTDATKNTLAGPGAGITVAKPKTERIEGADTQLQDTPTTWQPDNTITPTNAASLAGTAYKGPTETTVAEAYAPLQAKADKAGREIATTTDAAGVKALQGGTGFDAQLAYVAGGNRLSGLRQKYGGLSKAVSDSKGLATAAANRGAADTKTAADAYGKIGKTFSDAETEAARVAGEKTRGAERDSWNNADDAFNFSVGADQNAILGDQQAGGHIATTGERPTGETFRQMLPQAFTHPASPMFIPYNYMVTVFDSLTPDEARQMLSMPKDPAFVQFVLQMGKKYGVKS